jgi:hypothetical protein
MDYNRESTLIVPNTMILSVVDIMNNDFMSEDVVSSRHSVSGGVMEQVDGEPLRRFQWRADCLRSNVRRTHSFQLFRS